MGNEINKSEINSSIIRTFISDVEKYDSTKNCNCWHLNSRPSMTLDKKAFVIVNSTSDDMNKKRKEQIEKKK